MNNSLLNELWSEVDNEEHERIRLLAEISDLQQRVKDSEQVIHEYYKAIARVAGRV